MTDEVKNFLIYTLGVVLSLLFTIHKIKSKYGDKIGDYKDFNPVIFSLVYTLYVLSSWIGLADMIISSIIKHYKSKNKEFSDKEISEWLKK